jgi:hypothetical protein
MSIRAFLIVVIGWVVVLGLSTTPVGAVAGFFVGVAIAFFVAPVVLLSGLDQAAWMPVLWVLIGLYAALVLYHAGRGVIDWRAGRRDAARRRWAIALSLVALVPAVLWSGEALQRAWP